MHLYTCHNLFGVTLQWHHNECDGVSNHRLLECLLNRLFRHRPKNTSKLHVTGLRWMPQHRTSEKSTLVQVMAWCHQATSHYLNQCWTRSPTPYGITGPQWVNSLAPGRCGCDFKCENVKQKLGIDTLSIQILNQRLLWNECQRTWLMVIQHWFM